MRNVFYNLGNVLCTIGFLLLVVSISVWLIGLETLLRFYETNKPIVFVGLVGLGLLVVGSCFSSLAAGKGVVPATSKSAVIPSAVSEGTIRCAKCAATNDPHAKFCNQCGAEIAAVVIL